MKQNSPYKDLKLFANQQMSNQCSYDRNFRVDFKLHLLKSAIWLLTGKRSHYEHVPNRSNHVLN